MEEAAVRNEETANFEFFVEDDDEEARTGYDAMFEAGWSKPVVAVVVFVAAIVVTAAFGRFFCGWFCPLGTLHNIVGSLRDRFRRVTLRVERYSKWQRGKYYVLAALLLMAACAWLLKGSWAGIAVLLSGLLLPKAAPVQPAIFLPSPSHD